MSLIAGRILSLLPAILFLNMAYGWITNPSEAAKGLGMPLLDDIGRSTQIGDFSAFFIGVGLFSLLGALTNKVNRPTPIKKAEKSPICVLLPMSSNKGIPRPLAASEGFVIQP
jgi:hypothetical protein